MDAINKVLNIFIVTCCVVAVVLFVLAAKQTIKCANVCNADPVDRCYSDRAVCLGKEQYYVREVHNE